MGTSMKQASVDGKAPVRRKLPLALLAATLILVSFIGYLLYINYRSHNALVSSSLRSFQLDMEKQSALMGYFFIERKYDIRALAGSQEIISYYTNRQLGMSEIYGLRLNLFLISNLLHRIIGEKYIERDPVYQRIALSDAGGRILVNAGGGDGPLPVIRRQPISVEPFYHIQNDGSSASVMLSMPVFFKSRTVGHIIAELKLDTLYRHFMGSYSTGALRGFVLTDDQGAPLCTENRRYCTFFDEQPFPRGTAAGGSDEFPYFSSGRETPDDLLIRRLAIPSSPLYLTAWARTREVYGPVAPWQIYLASAFFAAVVLAGVGLLIRFSIKNSLLHARYEAAARQRQLLESKNRELHKEMRLREAAEKALEAQKSIRIRSDRLRSLGEMAAGIAHELNQPLNAIKMGSDFLEMMIEKEMPVTEQQLFQIVREVSSQVDRAEGIIRRLRDFGRKTDFTKEKIFINDPIISVLDIIGRQLRLQNIDVQLQLTENLPAILAHHNRMEQVIFNLLTNARDAINLKEESTLRNNQRTIVIRSYTDNDRVVVCVSDTGIGIDPTVKDQIFEAFFTTKKMGEGMGLGLSITNGIVEDYGGKIQIDSIEGRGTTFHLSFPMVP